MKTLKVLIALAITTSLVACGGGGSGNTSTGGVYLTHAELAKEFVHRVNMDLNWDVKLVKTNTLQYNYIVVKDGWEYEAYYIGKYNPGEDLKKYIKDYKYKFYYDLEEDGYDYYIDPDSGTRFEKVQMTSKNLAVAKALKQEIAIADAAVRVQMKYGLSDEKALDAARFAYKIKKAPAGTYKMSDFDNFAKELTGSTITEFQKDFKSGNLVSLTERIQKASEVTGIGPENMNALIQDVFLK